MQITLDELLFAREERARIQKEMQEEHSVPLVCFTMNIPGPEKTNPLIERAFFIGVSLILEEISADIVARYENCSKCGPVSIFAVNRDAEKLKQKFTKIEETHPIGRLFDIDVIDSSGRHVSRDAERGCMICGSPGRACAAGRLHPVSELVKKVNEILSDYFLNSDAKRLAALAKDSLILEVYTYPKPGLVDPESRGAHSDMDVSDFVSSAEALESYFEECVIAGVNSRGDSVAPIFPILKELGIEAEKKMYEATDGKNTHKGAIFSFGIVLGAIGRLLTPLGQLPSLDEILSEASKICRPYVERDFPSAVGATAGERAFIELGKRGIRGEAADGFPTVKNISYPTFKAYLSSGKSKNDAGAFTLIHLIADVYDTCLYNRGGDGGVVYARGCAKAFLSSETLSMEKIREMDLDFIKKNLSPGGCADLLALTYFLYELEAENFIQKKQV